MNLSVIFIRQPIKQTAWSVFWTSDSRLMAKSPVMGHDFPWLAADVASLFLSRLVAGGITGILLSDMYVVPCRLCGMKSNKP